MSWWQLKIPANETDADYISDLLSLSGAVSVTLSDAKDQPIYEPPPGATPLWSQIWVLGLYEKSIDIQQVIAVLKQTLPTLQTHDFQISEVVDEDWSQSWMAHFHPMQFGKRLWICPSHEDIDATDAVKVILDPGLAFGTGTHPTTALCLQWLDENITGGETVIDYGCGSGILAIAAIKLGARQVYAIDNDPQAIQASRENSLRNDIAENKFLLGSPEQFKNMQADILVANILANPLVELADSFANMLKTGNKLALSGILTDQITMVMHAYTQNFILEQPIVKEEWVLITGVRK